MFFAVFYFPQLYSGDRQKSRARLLGTFSRTCQRCSALQIPAGERLLKLVVPRTCHEFLRRFVTGWPSRPSIPNKYLIAGRPLATRSSPEYCTYRVTDRRVQATWEGGSSDNRGTRPSPVPLTSSNAAAMNASSSAETKRGHDNREFEQNKKNKKLETFELRCKPSREDGGHR